MDDKQDLYGANSLETQSKEQEDQNDNHSETEHDGDEFESIGHLYRSVRNGRGMNENDEDTHNDEDIHDEFPFEHSPFHFPPIYTDTTYQEDTAPAHFIPDNKREDDDIMDDKPDAGNKNLLETQSKGQGEHRETEHDEDKLESIRHHESAREARVMVEDDEDVHDEFPFEHSPFHFPPIYTDTTYTKDTAPEHFFPSRAKHRGTDNKRADDDIVDNKADVDNANLLETQSKEQGDNIVNHGKTEHDVDRSESLGHNGSNGNRRGVVEKDEDVHDDFPLQHSSYREDEKRLVTDNKKVDDDIMGDNADTGNANSLETQPEEQGDHRGTEHEELESIGHYHGSAREAREMVKDYEDVHDEFPFEHSPFHFRPIYTDTTYQEDIASKHFFPSRAKYRGTDNKRADDDIMDDKTDADKADLLETQSKEQGDNIVNHGKTEHNGDGSESLGHNGSVRNRRGVVEKDEDVHDDFPLQHSSYQEDDKHLVTDNKKVDDDIMGGKPDAGNANSLETQTEEQEDHRGTEHDGNKLESIGHYHGSAREAREMVKDDEDVHDEFPFEHSPFHFRPIYTDTTYQEDMASKHFFPSRAKYRSADNKRADDGIMGNKADADNANLLETQSKEQGDNIVNHSKTEQDGDEPESLGHNGSVGDRRGVVEEDKDVHDDFPLQHSPYRENEKLLVADNKKVDDDIMGENADAGNANSLETQTEEQEDHRGTEHDGDKLESIGHYHGSAREARGMVEDDEDVHDEFPFEHSPFHFRPIYTDTTYQEDIASKHFFPSRAKYRGPDNKKADDDIMDDKPDAGNLLEPQSKEHLDHSETEHDGDELESIGYYHGSAREARGVIKDGEDVQDDFPFQHFSYNFRPIHTDNAQLEVGSLEHFVPLHEQDHGMEIKKLDTNAGNVGLRRHRRVSQESHEIIDHEPETATEETKTPEGSKNKIYEDGGASFEVIDSFGNSYSDVIGLATRYRATESEVSQEKGAKVSNEDVGALYVENGFPDEGGHVADNRKDLVSHDEDNLKGDPEALEKEGYFQTSGGDREEGRASELDEDDGKYFLGESDLEETETLDGSEDDEDEFQTSGGKLAEVEASERDEDDEDDLLPSGNDFHETVASDWNYDDEDEIETSGADLGETEASEWDKDDGEDFEASGGETEKNKNGVSDANGPGNFELVDGVAYSGHASQLGYEEAKGLGKGHISKNVDQNE